MCLWIGYAGEGKSAWLNVTRALSFPQLRMQIFMHTRKVVPSRHSAFRSKAQICPTAARVSGLKLSADPCWGHVLCRAMPAHHGQVASNYCQCPLALKGHLRPKTPCFSAETATWWSCSPPGPLPGPAPSCPQWCGSLLLSNKLAKHKSDSGSISKCPSPNFPALLKIQRNNNCENNVPVWNTI